MNIITSAIACNLDSAILLASLPLLEAEKVGAIEWSFDTLLKGKQMPLWFFDLLQAFGREDKLVGHGVFFSLFSGKWLPEQTEWLTNLKQLSTTFRFDHITEHFGFMTGEDFHKGAPISIPFTATTLSLACDRLKRIQDACCCPVGLENLAFSYSLSEVKKHGDFLEQIVESVNGFIILDLHNLYCQMHNFGVSFDDLIIHYPLDKVREIHVSGGSWESALGQLVRRDTHDYGVPDEVFELLVRSIAMCPNLKYVVLEQLGIGLVTEASKHLFRQDFLRLDAIVQAHNALKLPASSINNFLPIIPFVVDSVPFEDAFLYGQQMELSAILENAVSYEEAKLLLERSSLANSDWAVEEWQPYMLETARSIAQKWKRGWL